MKNYIILAIISVIMTGCATAYHKRGLTGGFSETQIGENVFRVTFKGNAYTSRERVSDFTLLRSAELALENGYKYFVIIDSEKYTKKEVYAVPKSSYTTGSAYGATTVTSGGQTFIYSKPSSTNTIICFKEKPKTDGMVYDAEFIVKSIKDKYGIKN